MSRCEGVHKKNRSIKNRQNKQSDLEKRNSGFQKCTKLAMLALMQALYSCIFAVFSFFWQPMMLVNVKL